MKKASLEFVAFDTEDVIATSGVSPEPVPSPDPCPDGVEHLYVGKYQLNGDTVAYGDGCYAVSGKGREHSSWEGFTQSIGAFSGQTIGQGWYIKQNHIWVPCGNDHTGW